MNAPPSLDKQRQRHSSNRATEDTDSDVPESFYEIVTPKSERYFSNSDSECNLTQELYFDRDKDASKPSKPEGHSTRDSFKEDLQNTSNNLRLGDELQNEILNDLKDNEPKRDENHNSNMAHKVPLKIKLKKTNVPQRNETSNSVLQDVMKPIKKRKKRDVCRKQFRHQSITLYKLGSEGGPVIGNTSKHKTINKIFLKRKSIGATSIDYEVLLQDNKKEVLSDSVILSENNNMNGILTTTDVQDLNQASIITDSSNEPIKRHYSAAFNGKDDETLIKVPKVILTPIDSKFKDKSNDDKKLPNIKQDDKIQLQIPMKNTLEVIPVEMNTQTTLSKTTGKHNLPIQIPERRSSIAQPLKTATIVKPLQAFTENQPDQNNYLRVEVQHDTSEKSNSPSNTVQKDPITISLLPSNKKEDSASVSNQPNSNKVMQGRLEITSIQMEIKTKQDDTYNQVVKCRSGITDPLKHKGLNVSTKRIDRSILENKPISSSIETKNSGVNLVTDKNNRVNIINQTIIQKSNLLSSALSGTPPNKEMHNNNEYYINTIENLAHSINNTQGLQSASGSHKNSLNKNTLNTYKDMPIIDEVINLNSSNNGNLVITEKIPLNKKKSWPCTSEEQFLQSQIDSKYSNYNTTNNSSVSYPPVTNTHKYNQPSNIPQKSRLPQFHQMPQQHHMLQPNYITQSSYPKYQNQYMSNPNLFEFPAPNYNQGPSTYSPTNTIVSADLQSGPSGVQLSNIANSNISNSFSQKYYHMGSNQFQFAAQQLNTAANFQHIPFNTTRMNKSMPQHINMPSVRPWENISVPNVRNEKNSNTYTTTHNYPTGDRKETQSKNNYLNEAMLQYSNATTQENYYIERSQNAAAQNTSYFRQKNNFTNQTNLNNTQYPSLNTVESNNIVLNVPYYNNNNPYLMYRYPETMFNKPINESTVKNTPLQNCRTAPYTDNHLTNASTLNGQMSNLSTIGNYAYPNKTLSIFRTNNKNLTDQNQNAASVPSKELSNVSISLVPNKNTEIPTKSIAPNEPIYSIHKTNNHNNATLRQESNTEMSHLQLLPITTTNNTLLANTSPITAVHESVTLKTIESSHQKNIVRQYEDSILPKNLTISPVTIVNENATSKRNESPSLKSKIQENVDFVLPKLLSISPVATVNEYVTLNKNELFHLNHKLPANEDFISLKLPNTAPVTITKDSVLPKRPNTSPATAVNVTSKRNESPQLKCKALPNSHSVLPKHASISSVTTVNEGVTSKINESPHLKSKIQEKVDFILSKLPKISPNAAVTENITLNKSEFHLNHELQVNKDFLFPKRPNTAPVTVIKDLILPKRPNTSYAAAITEDVTSKRNESPKLKCKNQKNKDSVLSIHPSTLPVTVTENVNSKDSPTLKDQENKDFILPKSLDIVLVNAVTENVISKEIKSPLLKHKIEENINSFLPKKLVNAMNEETVTAKGNKSIPLQHKIEEKEDSILPKCPVTAANEDIVTSKENEFVQQKCTIQEKECSPLSKHPNTYVTAVHENVTSKGNELFNQKHKNQVNNAYVLPMHPIAVTATNENSTSERNESPRQKRKIQENENSVLTKYPKVSNSSTSPLETRTDKHDLSNMNNIFDVIVALFHKVNQESNGIGFDTFMDKVKSKLEAEQSDKQTLNLITNSTVERLVHEIYPQRTEKSSNTNNVTNKTLCNSISNSESLTGSSALNYAPTNLIFNRTIRPANTPSNSQNVWFPRNYTPFSTNTTPLSDYMALDLSPNRSPLNLVIGENPGMPISPSLDTQNDKIVSEKPLPLSQAIASDTNNDDMITNMPQRTSGNSSFIAASDKVGVLSNNLELQPSSPLDDKNNSNPLNENMNVTVLDALDQRENKPAEESNETSFALINNCPTILNPEIEDSSIERSMTECKENAAMDMTEHKENASMGVIEYKENVSMNMIEYKETVSTNTTECKANASIDVTECKENAAMDMTEHKENASMGVIEYKENVSMNMMEYKETVSTNTTECKANASIDVTECKESATQSSGDLFTKDRNENSVNLQLVENMDLDSSDEMEISELVNSNDIQPLVNNKPVLLLTNEDVNQKLHSKLKDNLSSAQSEKLNTSSSDKMHKKKEATITIIDLTLSDDEDDVSKVNSLDEKLKDTSQDKRRIIKKESCTSLKNAFNSTKSNIPQQEENKKYYTKKDLKGKWSDFPNSSQKMIQQSCDLPTKTNLSSKDPENKSEALAKKRTNLLALKPTDFDLATSCAKPQKY